MGRIKLAQIHMEGEGVWNRKNLFPSLRWLCVWLWCWSFCPDALPRGRVALAGAELTGLILGESPAGSSMAVAMGPLRELLLRVTLGPLGATSRLCYQKEIFTGEHSEKAREQERSAGASSLFCSTDYPEL